MKKLCLRIAVSLVGFAGLGITAKAQVVDQIVVTIPFEFVVAGKTLPAGTYRVNRVSDGLRDGCRCPLNWQLRRSQRDQNCTDDTKHSPGEQ
jgi:hypothetical protein